MVTTGLGVELLAMGWDVPVLRTVLSRVGMIVLPIAIPTEDCSYKEKHPLA